jgi:hypothetical protein
MGWNIAVDKPLDGDLLTAAEKVRVAQAVMDMRAGRLQAPPERCGLCRGTALTQDPEFSNKVLCQSCGRSSDKDRIKVVREQEIRRVLFEIGKGSGNVRLRRR